MGVTTIDDDVARLEVRNELLDESVNGRPSLDEEDDLAGTLELGAELLDRPGADDLGACMSEETAVSGCGRGRLDKTERTYPLPR